MRRYSYSKGNKGEMIMLSGSTISQEIVLFQTNMTEAEVIIGLANPIMTFVEDPNINCFEL